MSVLCSNNKGWVISHYDYSKNLYRNVHSSTGKVDLAYNKRLFKISSPFMKNQEAENMAKFLLSDVSIKKVKRKRRCIPSTNDEVLVAKNSFINLMEEAKNASYFKFTVTSLEIRENNCSARDFVNEFYESLVEEKDKKESCGLFEGIQDSPSPKIVSINDRKYVLPPYSIYKCCDISAFHPGKNKRFDFILLDPPWWNKHVRRKKKKCSIKGYKMMDESDIMKIPLGNYLENSSLVGVWCTNASSLIELVKEKLFPSWGLQYIASWLWIKVTESGEAVCSFENSNGKKPYERIIFGAAADRPFRNPEEYKCFLSIPSAIHSHKPPITDIMKDYLPENPKCLELFARYLLPGWTSVGNEVLLLQSQSLFEELK